MIPHTRLPFVLMSRRMKISAIETYIAGNPWKNWLFTKVLTDEDGLYGVGEGTVNYFAKTVETCCSVSSCR